MNKLITLTVIAGALFATSMVGQAHVTKDEHADRSSTLKLQNLMTEKLARVANTEVIVSHVEIPPNTTLPKHWHPGEEFAYVISGKVTLWQQGKEDIIGSAGEVVKVPLKQIHTAKTGDEGATILVFRVHEAGKPERIKVD